jgi:hypothetical protein
MRIVEFGDQGRDRWAAAAGCTLATSLAFIFGVVPLAWAIGGRRGG